MQLYIYKKLIMPVQDKIRRYNLIIEKIQKSKKPSFSEIQHFLMKQDFPVSHRTLQRDIEQIKYELSISIEYDKSTNGYYIQNQEYSKNVLDLLQQKSFYTDLIEFTRENPKQKDAILLDTDMHQVGFEYVQEILAAIRNQRKIEFEYQKFKEEDPKKYIIEPYCLKEFENRWYLVGVVNDKPNLHKFGIERILNMKVSTLKFKKEKHISTMEHFALMIGVNDEQRKREIIHLAFTPLQAKYIDTLALHWSQKLVSKEKDWVTYEYYLIPNFELEQKILGYGMQVKVLKPLKLRNRIVQLLQQTLTNYQK